MARQERRDFCSEMFGNSDDARPRLRKCAVTAPGDPQPCRNAARLSLAQPVSRLPGPSSRPPTFALRGLVLQLLPPAPIPALNRHPVPLPTQVRRSGSQSASGAAARRAAATIRPMATKTIEVDAELPERAQRVVEKRGVAVPQLMQEARGRELVSEKPQPPFSLIGAFTAGRSDLSARAGATTSSRGHSADL
jgi:hypothetical protein